MTDFETKLLLKQRYYEFFDNINFYPTLQDISLYFNKSEQEVMNDIRILRLTYRYSKLKKKMEKLLARKDIYEQYYYSELKYSISQMSKMLDVSEYEVITDIEEINRRFYGGNMLNRISEENINKPIKIVNRELLKIKLLNLFKTLTYIPSEAEIFEMVGVEGNNLTLLLKNLDILSEYLSFLNMEPLFNRLSVYKEYYFNLEKYYTMQQMAELLGIPTNEVSNDIRILKEKYNIIRPKRAELNREEKTLSAKISVNGVKYSFEDRKEIYNKIIEKYGYIPFKRIVSEETGIDKQIVSNDFLVMGIEPVTQTWWYKNVYLREETLKHLDVYKKYFFDTDTPLNREELAKIIGICHVTVSNELVYARDFLGCKKRVNEERESRLEEKRAFNKAKNEELSKPIFDRDSKYFNERESKVINRGNYYRLNYLESFNPMTLDGMAKDLGITYGSAFRAIKKLKNEENSSLRKLSKNKKGHFIHTDFDLRNQNYKMYFDKYGSVKNLKELAKKLHLGINIVLHDFSENNLYDIYKVEQYENRHKTDNTDLKKGTDFKQRLKMYNEFFDVNSKVDSISVLSKLLNLPKTTVQDDFDKYNLYKRFTVINATSNKDFESRYANYLKYFKRKGGKIESIEKLASDLKLRVMTVYSDFSKNNLYEEFGLKCKSAD